MLRHMEASRVGTQRRRAKLTKRSASRTSRRSGSSVGRVLTDGESIGRGPAGKAGFDGGHVSRGDSLTEDAAESGYSTPPQVEVRGPSRRKALATTCNCCAYFIDWELNSN